MADITGIVAGLIIGILIGAVFATLIIWIVGKLGIGMEVDGFRPALIAAIFIAILSNVILMIWNLLGLGATTGLIGSIIHLLVTAAILLTAGHYIKGLRVKGFSGAIIASIAMAVVAWLINWAVSLVT